MKLLFKLKWKDNKVIKDRCLLDLHGNLEQIKQGILSSKANRLFHKMNQNNHENSKKCCCFS